MRFTRSVLWIVAWVMVLLASTTAMALSGPAAHAARHSPEICDLIKVRDSNATNVSVASPDGKYVVCVKEGSPEDVEDNHTTVYLWRKGYLRVLKRYNDIGSAGAFVWTADSSAFAWNFTYGGEVGYWSTVIFNIKNGHFLEIERMASRDFHYRLRKACHDDETDSNVYFLKWVDNQSLLIAVEAFPGGLDCRRPIPIDYYQVALPVGRIVKHLQGAEREAIKKEFPYL
jgi:hypothetical protein